jgi:hypothetical protein
MLVTVYKNLIKISVNTFIAFLRQILREESFPAFNDLQKKATISG